MRPSGTAAASQSGPSAVLDNNTGNLNIKPSGNRRTRMPDARENASTEGAAIVASSTTTRFSPWLAEPAR